MDKMQINLLIATFGGNDSVVSQIKKTFQEAGIDVLRCDVRVGKNVVLQYLSAAKDDTIVILSQYQQKNEYTPQEIDEISVMTAVQKVIVILGDNLKGSDYMHRLASLGIYTGVFDCDASIEYIANLILKGRSKREARIYYGIGAGARVVPEILEEFDTKNSVYFLSNYNGTIEDMSKRMKSLSGKISATNMLLVLRDLPPEVFDMVKRIDRYRAMCTIVEEQGGGLSEASVATEAVPEKKRQLLKKQEPDKVLTPVDIIGIPSSRKKVEIGMIATNIGLGCTYQSILLAYVLSGAKRGDRIAIVEFDNADANFETLCKIATGQGNTSGLNQFAIGNVDYFFNMVYSRFCTQYRDDYDYVVYDFGCCDDSTIDNYVMPLAHKFVVSSADEWKFEELAEFVRVVSEKDRNHEMVYLFPCADRRIMGDIAEMLAGNPVYTIPYETSPFAPSKRSKKLFSALIEGKKPSQRFAPAGTVGLNKRMRQSKSFYHVCAATLCMCAVILIGSTILTRTLNHYREKTVSVKAEAALEEKNAAIAELEKENAALKKEHEQMEREVVCLKSPVTIGQMILLDNVEYKTLYTEITAETFLSKEDIGRVAACVEIPADQPILKNMTALPVEELPVELMETTN